ncbi:MAG: bifunctional UDP-N-acetylglucosamine diphosphorylase/glucosamine-1-phosphate N-acetyltransferase GlmU [Ahrensia sp.]|nr:bifunctional UDP-N-acetylglucosamine diphosphorylase/glucosamine-1-phosphate N-acetyltransferase GlmU [Ahrensia sp.]
MNQPDIKRSCLVIILAAGEGKRMASSLPKVLHPVAGLPMVCHVIEAARAAGADAIAVVVGNQAERVEDAVRSHDEGVETFIQHERKGTAHAVLAARDAFQGGFDDVVVLNGDTPLIQADTILASREVLAAGSAVTVVGFKAQDPTGYGRLIVEDGALIAIREHKDASEAERQIDFCNSGIIAFRGDLAVGFLEAVENDNSQGEYYLPDTVAIARQAGHAVSAVEVAEEQTLGVNDRAQLAAVEALWQNRRRNAALLGGVSMAHPASVIFQHDTVVEADVTLEPNIVFATGVKVRSGATIRAFSHLESCEVGQNAVVGPYARLRPGTHVGEGAKIGNFVETKKTRVAKGAKINHLSYIGDADVGEGANIGAGTITCNYDGFGKHQTIIGAGAFIGTNTALVAPVSVGQNANTAAGSVVYEDVPADALAIERSKQANLEGKAKELRERYAARKAKVAQ